MVSIEDLESHLGRLLEESIVVLAQLALAVLTGGGCLVLLVDAVGAVESTAVRVLAFHGIQHYL